MFVLMVNRVYQLIVDKMGVFGVKSKVATKLFSFLTLNIER